MFFPLKQELGSSSVHTFELVSKTRTYRILKWYWPISLRDSRSTYPIVTKMAKYFVFPSRKYLPTLILRNMMKSRLWLRIQAIWIFTMCCKFPVSFSPYWLCKARCSFWKKTSYSGSKSKLNTVEQIHFTQRTLFITKCILRCKVP